MTEGGITSPIPEIKCFRSRSIIFCWKSHVRNTESNPYWRKYTNWFHFFTLPQWSLVYWLPIKLVKICCCRCDILHDQYFSRWACRYWTKGRLNDQILCWYPPVEALLSFFGFIVQWTSVTRALIQQLSLSSPQTALDHVYLLVTMKQNVSVTYFSDWHWVSIGSFSSIGVQKFGVNKIFS